MAPTNWTPIFKIVAAFITALILLVARVAGVDIGSTEANAAALALIPVIVGYFVPDK